MNLFDLFASLSLDTSQYDSGIKNARTTASNFAGALKTGLATAGSFAAKGIGLISGAATLASGALLALEANTEEYRAAQGKLNTAFEAAGFSADAAQEAYTGFYAILGDTDTATEASQLLAKLAQSEEDVSKWTEIAAGVYGTFGDALPVEGLIEASNETAKTGVVTGVLADALNWAGVSEDEFNKKLEAAGSEAERNRLIMQTLRFEYEEAAHAFYRNNEALIAAREAQAELEKSLASLGGTVTKIKTNLMGEFLPSIVLLVDAFNALLTGSEGASEQLSKSIDSFISKAVEKLPEFMNFGVQIISSISKGLIASIPNLISAAVDLLGQATDYLLTSGSGISSTITALINALVDGLTKGYPLYIEAIALFGLAVIEGIANSIPKIVESIPVFVDSIKNSFVELAPRMTEVGSNLLYQIATGILESLPTLAYSAGQLMSSFGEYLKTNLPALIENGVLFVKAFVQSLSENSGVIVDGALDLILALVQGIMDSLPVLLENIPDILTSFVSAINDNAPKLIDAGVKIMVALVDGLINSITYLIESIPTIIAALVDTMLTFNWWNIAITVVKSLADGFLNSGTVAAEGAKSIVETIKNEILTLPSKMIEAGKEIVKGIWEGITSMGSWLKESISGFAGGLVDSAKKALGINSPSKAFAEIGGYMAEGLDNGWMDEYNSVKSNIESGLSFTAQPVQTDLSMYGGGQQQNQKESIVLDVTFELDGATLGRKVYNYNRDEATRRGEAFA